MDRWAITLMTVWRVELVGNGRWTRTVGPVRPWQPWFDVRHRAVRGGVPGPIAATRWTAGWAVTANGPVARTGPFGWCVVVGLAQVTFFAATSEEQDASTDGRE